MNCFKLEAETLTYLQNQQNNLHSLTQWLHNILQIHTEFLPQTPTPHLDYFWLALVEPTSSRDEKQLKLLRVAGAFYRLQNPAPYIVAQFNRLLSNSRSIPLLIKFNELFKQVAALLRSSRNILEFRCQCLDLQEQMAKICENEQFYILYKWKLDSCVIVCNEVLQKKPYSKNQFIRYLRTTKKLREKDRLLSDELTLDVYEKIINSSTNKDQIEINNKYLNLQFQALYTKLGRNKQQQANSSRRKLFKNITNREQKQQIDAYFEEQKPQNTQRRWRRSNQKFGQRKQMFFQSLAYFVHRPRESRSQHVRKAVAHKPALSILSKANESKTQQTSRQGFMIKRTISKKKLLYHLNINQNEYMVKSNGIRYSSNMYREITSTEKREVVLTNEMLEEELAKFQQDSIEKPTPTLNQILLAGDKNNSTNTRESCMSIKGFGSSEQIFCFDNYELTMTQFFGPYIGFLKMKSSNISNEHHISFSYNQWDFQNQPIQAHNSISFTLQDLRREISTSQFYFELIKASVEKDISNEDLLTVQKVLDQEENISSQLPFIIIFMGRLTRASIYWYYTKASKINGTLFVRRETPPLVDPLKFAIALDFIKKHNHRECFKKLSKARNKTAIFECFCYLLYGRKFICKNFINFNRKFCFYSITLENLTSDSFKITENVAYFHNLEFSLKIYNLKNWELLKNQTIKFQNTFSQIQITLLILENIIENKISKQNVTVIIEAIEALIQPKKWFKEENNLKSVAFQSSNQFNVKLERQKFSLAGFKMTNSFQILQKPHPKINNFISLIMWFTQQYRMEPNLSVNKIITKIIHIQSSYYQCSQIQLGIGIKVFMIHYLSGNLEILIKKISEQTNNQTSQNYPKKQQTLQICFKKQITPYFTRIVEYSPNKSYFKVQKIKGNTYIQQYEEDFYQVVCRKIIKTQFPDHRFMYLTIFFHKRLDCWRIEIYLQKNSKRFFSFLHKDTFSQKIIDQSLIQSFEVLSSRGDEVWLFGKMIKLTQAHYKFNTLHFEDQQTILQLVEVNEQLYLLIVPADSSLPMYSHRVQEIIFNENLNIFSDCKKKSDHSNRLLGLIRIMYHRFFSCGLPMQKIDHLSDINNLT